MENAAAANNDAEDLAEQDGGQPEPGTAQEHPQQQPELTVVDSGAAGSVPETGTSVKTARFAPLEPGGVGVAQNTMDLLLDVHLELSVELGRATTSVRDVLQLGPGSVVELNKLGGEPVDVLVNGRPIARGEVVVVDENFGVRVTEIVSPADGSSHGD
jgi:flagellar motor switch protein FliN/FliY